MSGQSLPDQSLPDRSSRFRTLALVCAAAGTAFWIYTFHYISRLPAGDGSGFQWLGEVPLTAIVLFAMVPAFMLSIFRKVAWLAALFGIGGLIAFAVVWTQLLSEFKH